MDVDEDDDGLGDFIEEDEFEDDGGEAAQRARERKKARKKALTKGKAGKRGGEGGISKAFVFFLLHLILIAWMPF